MGDIVESHAYNFRKEVGYDLFKQCEEIADRLRIEKPIPPRTGDQMTELTAKYYSEILETHIRVKEEEGEDHPTFIKLLGLKVEKEEREEREREREAERKKMLLMKNQLELQELSNHTVQEREIELQKELEKEREAHYIGMGDIEPKAIMSEVSDDSQIEERSVGDLVPDSSRPSIDPGPHDVSPRESSCDDLKEGKEIEEGKEKKEKEKEEKEREEESVKEELSMIDIDTLPTMRSLLIAIEAAKKVNITFYFILFNSIYLVFVYCILFYFILFHFLHTHDNILKL